MSESVRARYNQFHAVAKDTRLTSIQQVTPLFSNSDSTKRQLARFLQRYNLSGLHSSLLGWNGRYEIDQFGKLRIYGKGVFNQYGHTNSTTHRPIPAGEYSIDEVNRFPMNLQLISRGKQYKEYQAFAGHNPVNQFKELRYNEFAQIHTGMLVSDQVTFKGGPVTNFPISFYTPQNNQNWEIGMTHRDGKEVGHLKRRLYLRYSPLDVDDLVRKHVNIGLGPLRLLQDDNGRGVISQLLETQPGRFTFHENTPNDYPLRFIYGDGGYRGKVTFHLPYLFDPWYVDGWDRPVQLVYGNGEPRMTCTWRSLGKHGIGRLAFLGGKAIIGERNIFSADNRNPLLVVPQTPYQPLENNPEQKFGVEKMTTQLITVSELNENSGLYRAFDWDASKLTHTLSRKKFRYTTPLRFNPIFNNKTQRRFIYPNAVWFNFTEFKQGHSPDKDKEYLRPIQEDNRNSEPERGLAENKRLFVEYAHHLFPSLGRMQVFGGRNQVYCPSETSIRQHPYLRASMLALQTDEMEVDFGHFNEVIDTTKTDINHLATHYHWRADHPLNRVLPYSLPNVGHASYHDLGKTTQGEYQEFPLSLSLFKNENIIEGYYPSCVDDWGVVEQKVNLPTVYLDGIQHHYHKMRERPFWHGLDLDRQVSRPHWDLVHAVGGVMSKVSIELNVMGNKVWLKPRDIIYPESIYPVQLRGDVKYPSMDEQVEHPRLSRLYHILYHPDFMVGMDVGEMTQFYPVLCVNEGYIQNGVAYGDVWLYNWEDGEYYCIGGKTLRSFQGLNQGNFLGLNQEERERSFVEENRIVGLLKSVKRQLMKAHFPLRARFPNGKWCRHDNTLFRFYIPLHWDGVRVSGVECLDLDETRTIEACSWTNGMKLRLSESNHSAKDYVKGHYVFYHVENDNQSKPAEYFILNSLGDSLVLANRTSGYNMRTAYDTEIGIEHYNKDFKNLGYYNTIKINHHEDFRHTPYANHQAFRVVTETDTRFPGVASNADRWVHSRTIEFYGRTLDYIPDMSPRPLLPARESIGNYPHQHLLPEGAYYDWAHGVYRLNDEAKTILSQRGIKLLPKFKLLFTNYRNGHPQLRDNTHVTRVLVDSAVPDTVKISWEDFDVRNVSDFQERRPKAGETREILLTDLFTTIDRNSVQYRLNNNYDRDNGNQDTRRSLPHLYVGELLPTDILKMHLEQDKLYPHRRYLDPGNGTNAEIQYNEGYYYSYYKKTATTDYPILRTFFVEYTTMDEQGSPQKVKKEMIKLFMLPKARFVRFSYPAKSDPEDYGFLHDSTRYFMEFIGYPNGFMHIPGWSNPAWEGKVNDERYRPFYPDYESFKRTFIDNGFTWAIQWFTNRYPLDDRNDYSSYHHTLARGRGTDGNNTFEITRVADENGVYHQGFRQLTRSTRSGYEVTYPTVHPRLRDHVIRERRVEYGKAPHLPNLGPSWFRVFPFAHMADNPNADKFKWIDTTDEVVVTGPYLVDPAFTVSDNASPLVVNATGIPDTKIFGQGNEADDAILRLVCRVTVKGSFHENTRKGTIAQQHDREWILYWTEDDRTRHILDYFEPQGRDHVIFHQDNTVYSGTYNLFRTHFVEDYRRETGKWLKPEMIGPIHTTLVDIPMLRQLYTTEQLNRLLRRPAKILPIDQDAPIFEPNWITESEYRSLGKEDIGVKLEWWFVQGSRMGQRRIAIPLGEVNNPNKVTKFAKVNRDTLRKKGWNVVLNSMRIFPPADYPLSKGAYKDPYK